MKVLYRRFERRMGWEEQPWLVVCIGWAMVVEGVVIFTTAACLKILGVA